MAAQRVFPDAAVGVRFVGTSNEGRTSSIICAALLKSD